MSGVLKDDGNSFWDDCLSLLKLKGINMESGLGKHTPTLSWCPLKSLEVPSCYGHGTRNPVNGGLSSWPEAIVSSMITSVASILETVGEDPSRKELLGTPYGFMQWMIDFKKSNLEIKLDNFNLGRIGLHPMTCLESSQQLNLPFCSQCEHHLLPFHGVVHICYFNCKEGYPVDRSMLQSLVKTYSSRLQVQERLTKQIAEAVFSVFIGGVMVVVEANHICMMSRGIEKVGSSTTTIAIMGRFSTDPIAKTKFLQSIPNRVASVG